MTTKLRKEAPVSIDPMVNFLAAYLDLFVEIRRKRRKTTVRKKHAGKTLKSNEARRNR